MAWDGIDSLVSRIARIPGRRIRSFERLQYQSNQTNQSTKPIDQPNQKLSFFLGAGIDSFVYNTSSSSNWSLSKYKTLSGTNRLVGGDQLTGWPDQGDQLTGLTVNKRECLHITTRPLFQLLPLKPHLCKFSLEAVCIAATILHNAYPASFNVKDSLICRRCCSWWGLLVHKSQTLNTFTSLPMFILRAEENGDNTDWKKLTPIGLTWAFSGCGNNLNHWIVLL